MTTGVQKQGKGLSRIAPGLFRLAALALVGAPLAIALSALSGWGHRGPDLLAQFTAPSLLPTLVLAVGLALIRRFRWAATAAAAAGLLALAAWPQWFPPEGEAAAAAPILRVYSANLWARNEEVAAIAASIREADTDILVLIELGDAPAAQLETLLVGYPHRVVTPRVDRASGAARSVIASRRPLTAIPDRADGLHAVAAVAETPLGPVNIVGVHLTRPWPFQEQWGQISQTMALADIRQGLRGPVIVAGDFNSVSSARIGRQMKDDVGLIPAPGLPGTWPAALPPAFGVTIDHVWRSPDLALVGRRLGRPTGSDHRPVVVELTRALP
ncbi:endonuclease/exonuclease/phosphatase family protein [Brevundimonas sp.]|uniref:endonuclease/exonuclease/phosphatase family protein n=1 Tax=Brevundimonas sp. TaxID=1871086 RepID=UPI0035AF3B35